jgi:hypothetical protein
MQRWPHHTARPVARRLQPYRMTETIKSGLRSLFARNREQLFLLVCLAGLLPALVTNTLYTTALFPGVESFHWSYFHLATWRYAYSALLLAAIVLGMRLEKRCLLLAVLPLLGLVVLPLDRIGAVRGYPVAGVAQAYDLARARQQLSTISTPEDIVARTLIHLPPRLNLDGVTVALSNFELLQRHRNADSGLQRQEGELLRQRSRLQRDLDNYQHESRQPFAAVNGPRWRFLQQSLRTLPGDIRRLNARLAQIAGERS